MKNKGILCIFVLLLCVILFTAGCTSSKPATTSLATPAAPAASATNVSPAVQTSPACPDKLVWDGAWDSAHLGMAGNHDLSTAFTKYPGEVYGDRAIVKMSQICWDVEGTLSITSQNCAATFKGTVDKNVLSGTWSSAPKTCSKSQDGRKFSLTMTADNKSWFGDLYDSMDNPVNFPPNWAGRRNP